jgi:hypothetical protein
MLEKFDLAQPLFGFFEGGVGPTQITARRGHDLITTWHSPNHFSPSEFSLGKNSFAAK